MSLLERNEEAFKIFFETRKDLDELSIEGITIDKWVEEIGGELGIDPTPSQLAAINSQLFLAINTVYKALSTAELHYNYLNSLVKAEKVKVTADIINESKADGKRTSMEKIAALTESNLVNDNSALDIANMKLAFLKSVLAKLMRLSERLDQQAKILFGEKKYASA